MYVLTALFGDYYQSKIIEVFIENYDEDLSRPEIVEMANTSWGSTYKYIDYLISEKIIRKSRKIGKTQLYKLNLDHSTTKILFQLEHERFTENIGRLVGKLPIQKKTIHKEPIITIIKKNGEIKKQYEDGSEEIIYRDSSTKWNITKSKIKRLNYSV